MDLEASFPGSCCSSSTPLDFGMEKSRVATMVVTGFGTVNGRTVFTFAKDCRVRRLAVENMRRRYPSNPDMAMKARAPIIGLFDAGNARIQEAWPRSATARCSSATSSRRA